MQFMVMHKVDASMEAGTPPNQEIIQGMGELVGESLKAGVMLDGAGLHRSAQRVRLSTAGGSTTVTHGPFQGQNELVAGMAMLKAKSMDHAIEQAKRFAGAIGDGEIEIGPVVEAWDLGMMPKPDVEGGRFLLLCKSDPKNEAGATAAQTAALGALHDELTQSGALLKTVMLAPSSKGKRLQSAPKDKRTWVDGPFAESKELIAGFSILDLPSLDDAIAWANRYAAILEGNEVDVRQLQD